MNSLQIKLNRTIQNSFDLLYDVSFMSTYDATVKILAYAIKNDGKIYIAGNGGSNADALHLSGELIGKIKDNRPPIAAEALTIDSCIANDYGYEYVFSRQLEAKCSEKDVFIAFSTSGNSKNILEALKNCKGIKILFSGKKPGQCHKYCDILIDVPGNTTDQIQEMHEVVYHSLVYDVEKMLNE